jgi:hypothetical protein
MATHSKTRRAVQRLRRHARRRREAALRKARQGGTASPSSFPAESPVPSQDAGSLDRELPALPATSQVESRESEAEEVSAVEIGDDNRLDLQNVGLDDRGSEGPHSGA